MKKILVTCLVCLPVTSSTVQVTNIYKKNNFISIGDWFKKAVSDTVEWFEKVSKETSRWLDKAVDNADLWIEKAVGDTGKWLEKASKETLKLIEKVFSKINWLRGKTLNIFYPGNGINAVEPTGLFTAKLWLNETIVKIIEKKDHLQLSGIMIIYIALLPTKMVVFSSMILAKMIIDNADIISSKNKGYGVKIEIANYLNMPLNVTSQSKP